MSISETTPAKVLSYTDQEGQPQTTLMHFGIGVTHYGPTVAIQEESQVVFVNPKSWPEMKAAIDEYFATQATQ